MKVVSVQVGLPRATGPKGFLSGIQKKPVSGLLHVGKINLAGDSQADLKTHGGPDKAICAYPLEHYAFWNNKLSLDFSAGDFGENFTTQYLLESDVFIDDIYRIGTALVQVSQPRQPCWKLAKRWGIKQLPLHVQETGRTGWYFRVLEEGETEAGSPLTLVERIQTTWSVAKANEVMHHHKTDWDVAAELANCPGLSANWRATLSHRAEKRTVEDSTKRLEGEA
ncbi:MOSC domain-containing protein [Oceaniferula spumae]|uniref:MOSC domain-containing protein n=1 Tax=Oceaniferula spumae TaxID=2979115 RepID=A0AAT9FP61_9BACT